MLRRDHNVEPHYCGVGVIAPFEKQKDGVKSISERVGPCVADEPSSLSHMMGSVATSSKLFYQTAAAAHRARTNVHLTKLGGSHLTQLW